MLVPVSLFWTTLQQHYSGNLKGKVNTTVKLRVLTCLAVCGILPVVPILLKITCAICFSFFGSNRSLITKCVDPDEVGKIFSIVGAFQAFLPFASSPLFGFLYRATVATFPAAFLFLVAALKLVEGKNKSIIGLILNGPVKSNQKMAVFLSGLKTWGVVPNPNLT